jgi:propane monooxygenase reductase subunit
VTIKYGCRHGNCSTCKYLLVDGEVDYGNASPYSLSELERDEGWALLCVATPLEDLVVQDDSPADPRALPLLAPHEQMAAVAVVEALTGGLFRVVLELLEPMTFYPGQFVELGVPGCVDEWRSYSIATPPSMGVRLGFVIQGIEGGAFSGQLENLAPGSEIPLRGPFGDGYLRGSEEPVLLVAGGGSGIAPILSILHHSAQVGDSRPITLVYGARQRAGLVALDEIESVAGRLSLTTVFCLSEPADADGWDGFLGDVTRAVQHFVGGADGLDAYLCGKPEMCDSVRRLLEAKGLDEGRAFADPFFPAHTGAGEFAGTA